MGKVRYHAEKSAQLLKTPVVVAIICGLGFLAGWALINYTQYATAGEVTRLVFTFVMFAAPIPCFLIGFSAFFHGCLGKKPILALLAILEMAAYAGVAYLAYLVYMNGFKIWW